jgi:hypothetical protein
MTRSNLFKLLAALAVLVVVLGVLFLGPWMGNEPAAGPDVRLPSMENVPPSGTHLKVEIQPEGASSE